MIKRVFLAVSSHGFGHLAQTLAVANALLERLSSLHFVIACDLPTAVIAERLQSSSFEHLRMALDLGVIQPDPLTVDVSATVKAYQTFHANYQERVDQLAATFKRRQIELVIADIPYLAIEAAAEVQIPSVAIASLSWEAILTAYLPQEDAEVRDIFRQIQQSLEKTTLVLNPEPAMALAHFPHSTSIGPLALIAHPILNLRNRLGIAADDRRPLVLVGLGGIPVSQLPVQAFEQDERFHWLLNTKIDTSKRHLHSVTSLQGLAYRNISASVDALVGKPGYATSVEVAVDQRPFVFTCRGDFPDEKPIVEWLHRHACSREISQSAFYAGDFGDALLELLKKPIKAAVNPSGAIEAADLIMDCCIK